MPKKKQYHYVEKDDNNPLHNNHLKWVIVSKRNGIITSHLNEETAIQHIDRINKKHPDGIDRSISYSPFGRR